MQTLSARSLCTLAALARVALACARRVSGSELQGAALRRGMRQPAAPL
ncbi:MAG: hypothetical protein WBC18_01265 [Ottowia sp.]